MSYEFPSKEWISAYKDALNGEPGKAWQKAAETWEGDFIFEITPDSIYKDNAYFYIDLWHGKCRDAKFLTNSDTIPEAEFQYIGTYTNWKKLLKGEIDPIRSVLMRKFKLIGSKTKLMQSATATKELVSTAKKIETIFY